MDVSSSSLLLPALPTGFIPGRYGAAPGTPTAVTAHRSHEQASKSSAGRIRTTYRAGLRMARNTKWIAGRIGCAERLGRLKRVIEANAPVSRGIYRLATTKAAAETKGGDRTVVVEFEAFRQRRERGGGNNLRRLGRCQFGSFSIVCLSSYSTLLTCLVWIRQEYKRALTLHEPAFTLLPSHQRHERWTNRLHPFIPWSH
jgi:hypothetical protein